MIVSSGTSLVALTLHDFGLLWRYTVALHCGATWGSLHEPHANPRIPVPKPGCFKHGCLQFLRGNALLRSLALFCGFAFAPFCALLRVSACDRRTTAFGNFRPECLAKNFCHDVGLEGKVLLRWTSSDESSSDCAPLSSLQDLEDITLLSKQVSLVRIHASHPESDERSSDIGVGGRVRILTTSCRTVFAQCRRRIPLHS